jgi:uncharacterized protein YjbI with pentapeptide repeats
MQTLLLQLDEDRKGVLLSFLHEAKLSRRKEIIPYEYAEYREYTKNESEENGEEYWNYPILRLDQIDFSGAKRTPNTKLTFDNLESIILRGAKLSKVNLSGANLKNADLRDADLSGAALRKPSRQDSEEIPGEFHSEAAKAKFPEGLMETYLSGANLRGANLRGANLSDANLSNAKVTDAQLAEAKSLQGATMPDRSKHP